MRKKNNKLVEILNIFSLCMMRNLGIWGNSNTKATFASGFHIAKAREDEERNLHYVTVGEPGRLD